jgi:putative ABC transport system ATP-binding protein
MARIPVIKTTGLTKEFELGKIKVPALDGVNLEIYSGEFIVFFGPSGCGKSTLMSMIAGLQPPSSGQITIRGEDLSKLNENQLADHRRSKIGMVFQSFNLVPTMNVLENIALPLAFARIPKKRRLARAENLLEVVDMSEYKKHTPTELSGGQQQRIAIARSLVANPWIILADEPTGNLDSKSANEVMRLLISLNRKSKRTIVLITHNPDYLDYADRIFYLRDGKVADIKVNAKVKKIEEVASVGKLKDELKPGKDNTAAEADKEEEAKKIVEEMDKGEKKEKKKEKTKDIEEEPVDSKETESEDDSNNDDNVSKGGLGPIKLG